METVKKNIEAVYSPQALHNAFSNSLVSPLLNKVFLVRGVYHAGKGMNYNGYYYDILKDEFSDYTITFVVPEVLRNRLTNDQLVEASVYLSKRNQPTVARMDLLLTVTELISNNDRSITESDLHRLDLVRKKAAVGFKDIDNYVRDKFYNEEPVNLTILVGLTAIIDQDIVNQLREAATAYRITFARTNFSQASEIVKALQHHESAEILVMARGGGENIHLFDHPIVCEKALEFKGILITALGHSSDQPLLEKIADKSFITPTALGQYLHDIYYETTESYNQSKAKMIDDLSKQIALNYETRIIDLGKRLEESTAALNQINDRTRIDLARMNVKLASAKANNKILAILLVVLIVAAFILLRLS
jgi:exodeoxyribonuclease VII large subunit